MPAFTSSLFLGIPKTESFDQALRRADPKLLQMFLTNSGDYLYEVEFRDMCYIGKHAGEVIDLKKLVLLESNVYSLLQKLFPDIAVTETPLKLIPLPQ